MIESDDPLGLNQFIGEPLNSELLASVQMYLTHLQGLGMIENFRVAIDPEDPSRVLIMPVRPISAITLNMVVASSGVSFKDILDESL